MNAIKTIVAQVISEAKKKKKKDNDQKYVACPKEYGYADAFDFSSPLGDENRYKAQGDSNLGPYTNSGNPEDKKLRAAIKETIREAMLNERSPWDFLSESLRMNERNPKNVWESLGRFVNEENDGPEREE